MRKPIILFLFLSFVSFFSVHAQENVALNKPIEASTVEGNNRASNANDGNSTTTRWESVHGLDDQWIEIDLESVYELLSMKIVWEGASAKEYEIQVSGDRINWEKIADKTSTSGARTDEFTFSIKEVTGVRYARLNLFTRTTGYGFSIYEWEIYGIEEDVVAIPSELEIYPKNVVLQAEIPEEFTILSLNNSLIQYNEQDAIFEQIAISGGKTASWTKQTKLGQSLRYHYEEGDGVLADGNPSARMMVRSQAWTHIILQEQSDKPLVDPVDFLASVKLWVDYIRTYCPNPNARIVLTLNWPYNNSADYAGEVMELYKNYKAVQNELGVSICPVGNAYELIRTLDGEGAMQALYSDNRHPTLLASYLSACTVYAHMFNESPVGLFAPASFSAAEALRIQEHAWNAHVAHADPINDHEGKVIFSCSLLDQFNRSMEIEGNVNWTVNEGGSIQDGVFITDGTTGQFTITAEHNGIYATTILQVVEGIEPYVDEYYVELQDGGTYQQDFDEIGTEADATLPLGWKIEKRLDSPRTLGSYIVAAQQTEKRGGVNIASNDPNGIYNFGAGDAATATDRAIGGMSTSISGGTRCVNIYLKIKNTGESEMNRFDITYNVEKYRKGSNNAGFVMQMYYSLDGENWVSAGENFRTFFEADTETGGYAVVPGDTRYVNATLNQSVQRGKDLYLAWNYSVASGTDCATAQALGLDDVSITAGYEEILDYAVINTAEVYSEDFDGIGTEAVTTLPLGWRIEKRLDAPRVLGSFHSAGDVTEQRAGNGMSSTATNGIYNFGAGDAATSTDRAIGGVSTGIAGTKGINIYLKVKNTGDTAIESLDIEYDVEKYRQGNNASDFIMQMYYSADGINWTSAGETFKNVFTRDTQTAGYDLAPGAYQHIESTLLQGIEKGEALYLAWNYSVASGTECAGSQALGLDNVKITANGIIATYAGAETLDKVQVTYSGNNLEVKGENVESVSLYTINGFRILSFYGEGVRNLTELPAGVYLVKVEGKDGTNTMTKIMR
ncbi:MAG: discoidin domain-containing protein [Candidatus Azobacteroides sp.]|nr:discoidin domain-containing protein [Candidatus Azobacteroides sp.]